MPRGSMKGLWPNLIRLMSHCPALAQAVQALVRKHEEAYLESEEQGDREFWVAFYNKPQTLPLRALKTGAIGHLTCFKVNLSFFSAGSVLS